MDLIEALKKADVIEIDGLFIGKNWSLIDDSDADVADRRLTANFVDDDSFEVYDWSLSFNDLAGAKFLASDGLWELTSNGEPFTLRVYELNPISIFS